MKRDESLVVERVHRVMVEFTSRCNLKCVYCAGIRPSYQPQSFEPDVLDSLIDEIIRFKPAQVCINGHGETTIYPSWWRYANRLLDAGIPVHVITNFAKKYSDEELQTLARFEFIQVSCDTANAMLFRKLRAGARLSTIVENMAKLRKTATDLGIAAPPFSWSCVVSDQSAQGLPQWAQLGLNLGVRYFNFNDLNKLPDIDGVPRTIPIGELPDSELLAASQGLFGAFRILTNAGVEYTYQHQLIETVTEFMEGKSAEFPPPQQGPDPAGNAQSSPPAPDSTRNCLDPWRMVFIQADGTVRPCCARGPIGTVDSSSGLGHVINGDRIRALRKALLDGELREECRDCRVYGLIPVEQLQQAVGAFLGGAAPGE